GILDAIAKGAPELVTSNTLNEAIERMLQTIGDAIDADRILVLEIQSAGPQMKLRHAWQGSRAMAEVRPEFFATLPAAVPAELAEWQNSCRQGGIIAVSRRDVSGATAELFDRFGIKSNLQAAIQVDKALFGQISVDDCRTERYWTAREIEAVGVLANLIGAAI